MNNGEDWSKETYSLAEKTIGYRFKKKDLLLACFTHKSFANNCGGTDNERLEWLGDAVLELIVSEKLFRTEGADEGELTKLRKQYVSMEALNVAAEELGLMRYLRRSGGENNLGPKAPSSLFEAVIAGIYLDGGFSAAKKFIEKNVTIAGAEDYKSALQEFVQARVKETPRYSVRAQGEGFCCVASALGCTGKGEGRSKAEAETFAAKALLEKLTEREKH